MRPACRFEFSRGCWRGLGARRRGEPHAQVRTERAALGPRQRDARQAESRNAEPQRQDERVDQERKRQRECEACPVTPGLVPTPYGDDVIQRPRDARQRLPKLRPTAMIDWRSRRHDTPVKVAYRPTYRPALRREIESQSRLLERRSLRKDCAVSRHIPRGRGATATSRSSHVARPSAQVCSYLGIVFLAAV